MTARERRLSADCICTYLRTVNLSNVPSVVIDTIGKRVGKKHRHHSLKRRTKNHGNRIINNDDYFFFLVFIIRYEPNYAFYKDLSGRQTRAVCKSVIIIIAEQQHRNPTTARPFFPDPQSGSRGASCV